MDTCVHCGGKQLIPVGDGGYKCRVTSCIGFKTPMSPGVVCQDCGAPMDYRGLNSWGAPDYKCTACGLVVTL
jgi:hypothetical protein